MFSNPRTAGWWLISLVCQSSCIRSNGSMQRCCSRLRHPFILCLIVVLLAALVSVVMFSSWNVCRPDIDDDVDAQIASSAVHLSTRSVRRPAKICLSPLTEAGVRVNISLDSNDDLQRSVTYSCWSKSDNTMALKAPNTGSKKVEPRMFYHCRPTWPPTIDFRHVLTTQCLCPSVTLRLNVLATR